MDALGKLVRKKRTAKKESVAQMARALDCSTGFAKHIEASQTVPISGRLITAIARHYKISKKVIEPLAMNRARKGKAYYRAYNKANR